MRYWDTSGIVPLLAREESSHAAASEFAVDGSIVTWWATRLECASAIARKERAGGLSTPAAEAARLRLRLAQEGWQEIEPTETVRQTAIRLLRVHALRTGDALQLAAAIEASEGNPHTLPFVTLDERLAEVASKEGFPVVMPRAG